MRQEFGSNEEDPLQNVFVKKIHPNKKIMKNAHPKIYNYY